MDIRRLAVKAMVQAQYPWVNEDDIDVKDNTDWWDNPHYAVALRDDGKDIKFALVVKVIPLPESD